MVDNTERANVRVGVRTRNLSEPWLRYIRQLGATDMIDRPREGKFQA